MKQELSPAVAEYLRFRGSQDYSRSTLKVDKQVLTRFLAVNGNIYCHQIRDRHVERHFEEANKTRSAASLRNDHNTLSKFFEWCRRTNRMPTESNPMYGRRLPRPHKRERNRIPISDFGRLLDAAEARDPRDRALVALLLYTLMRDGEVSNLRIWDLNLEGGWLKANISKSRQEDLMPICSELDAELRRWLTHYTTKVGPLKPHYHLIPARHVAPVHGDGGRISTHLTTYRPDVRVKATGRIVKPALEDIGFPTVDEHGKPLNEGSHTVRRSGARAFFDTLVSAASDPEREIVADPLRVVQSMLHHANSVQTEHYLGITADRRSRDDILRGKVMYARAADNVVVLAR